MHDIKNLPGLKAWEITKTITGNSVVAQGPIFYRVTVEQFVLDARAIERQAGLAMMLGSAVVAAVMGPDEDIAKRTQKRTGFIGGQDAMEMPVIAFLEGGEDDPER